MEITIDPKARPCPGVERAIALAEDGLRRGEHLFSAGPLIHNRREVERLGGLGLKAVRPEDLADRRQRKRFFGHFFLLRAHGEAEAHVDRARSCGMKIVDATCPIVHHSQDLVLQHVREGWRIVVVGAADHPEVKGLLARAGENGVSVASAKAASALDMENRTLLLAQSTVNPDVFAAVRHALAHRSPGLKIVDTTCRFLKNRQMDIRAFAESLDVVVFIAGRNSSNGKLLFETSLGVNAQTFLVEAPNELVQGLFKNGNRVGISGGASTPRWQLDEMRMFLETIKEPNPRGLKNKKGGSLLWWMRKNQKTKS
jgi:4-hydroxy-3-methylbut-2-en-1-yl diphosphate reductase